MARWTFRVQVFLAVVWALLVYPSMVWWKDSIAYLVMLSVYAVLAAHIVGAIAAWSECQAQKRNEEQPAQPPAQ